VSSAKENMALSRKLGAQLVLRLELFKDGSRAVSQRWKMEVTIESLTNIKKQLLYDGLNNYCPGIPLQRTVSLKLKPIISTWIPGKPQNRLN
jgi:hypothetical protein